MTLFLFVRANIQLTSTAILVYLSVFVICCLLFVYMYMYHHCSPHLFCQQLKVTTEPELSAFICEVSSTQQWKKGDLLEQTHHKVYHNTCMYSQLKH